MNRRGRNRRHHVREMAELVTGLVMTDIKRVPPIRRLASRLNDARLGSGAYVAAISHSGTEPHA